MSTWIWVAIVVIAAIVVLGVVAVGLRSSRSRKLQERFGPEYDRVAADAPTKREAESELREREKRRDEFEIRPLDPRDRDRYRTQWRDLQAEFVDEPATAVRRADALIQNVMRDRGYPVDDFDTRAADLSVDHPRVVENYRAGHAIATRNESGNAGTEDLRQALMHYRALFDELLETADREEAHR